MRDEAVPVLSLSMITTTIAE
jgi:hypothetical protein